MHYYVLFWRLSGILGLFCNVCKSGNGALIFAATNLGSIFNLLKYMVTNNIWEGLAPNR